MFAVSQYDIMGFTRALSGVWANDTVSGKFLQHIFNGVGLGLGDVFGGHSARIVLRLDMHPKPTT